MDQEKSEKSQRKVREKSEKKSEKSQRKVREKSEKGSENVNVSH